MLATLPQLYVRVKQQPFGNKGQNSMHAVKIVKLQELCLLP